MKKEQLVKTAVELGLHLYVSWHKSMFGILTTNTKYAKLKGNSVEVLLGDTWHTIEGFKKGEPILILGEMLTVDTSDFRDGEKGVRTTVGRYLANHILKHKFKDDFPYFNKQFSLGMILNDYIIPNAGDPGSGKKYTAQDIKRLGKVSVFIRSLAIVTVHVSTEKSMLPPPDLDKKKKEIYDKYVSKYGPDFTEDKVLVLSYEDELKEYYKEYIKDDPTFGLMLSPKILNTSKKRRYLSIGIASKLSDADPAVTILSSLMDEYPKDKEAIATIFNTIRYGSAARGLETQWSGVIAKTLIRMMHSFKIIQGDCGTKRHYPLLVTEQMVNGLTGLFDDKGIEQTEALLMSKVGKVVNFRSPLYCKQEGDAFCSTCCGAVLGRHETAMVLLAILLGGNALSNSLSKFHTKDLELNTIDIDGLLE